MVDLDELIEDFLGFLGAPGAEVDMAEVEKSPGMVGGRVDGGPECGLRFDIVVLEKAGPAIVIP